MKFSESLLMPQNSLQSLTVLTLSNLGVLAFAGMAMSAISAVAGGIYRDGAGARALSLGGASVANPNQPLEALQSNPAGLSATQRPQAQVGVGLVNATGEFSNSANAGADLDHGLGAWPEAAFALPLGDAPITIGIGFVPDAALGGEWNYVDAPGGLGGTTSYGFQEHRSKITALRSALGAGWQVTEDLAIGAGVGLVYNQNRLHAPYTFQSYPALIGGGQGFKTLLDLKTEGFGVNGTFGLTYRTGENITIGVSYQTPTKIRSHGDANGNAGVQLDNLFGPGVPPNFHYDAAVQNVFPQTVSAGLQWQATDRVRVLFQVDWVNWADAFDELEVYLNNGDNASINGVLGTPNIYDVIPLRWEDQFVYRLGVDFQATESIALRAGYSFGNNPVPSATLTPMTAAIMEHKLSIGAGWKNERWFIDAGYQYSLPTTQTVGTSALNSGEYSNSRTKVEVHQMALTVGLNF